VWEIRQALGDQAAAPQYIETVGQQGYRFVAETRDGPVGSGPAGTPGASHPAPAAVFVGRQAALADLQACLAQAQRGARQLLFVTGEVGIGKTTLVRQFLDHLPPAGPVWVGRGQCSEQVGPGEAYLPLLEALGRLGRAPGGAQLVAALRRAAPTWLVHLPMLVDASEVEALQRQVQGAGRDRMLRELVDALTLVTTHTVLVLVLEDLQWSDTATVEWLAYLARRPERLRLLVLGTYRPSEVIARGHPLRHVVPELVAHGLGQELGLELLTVAEVQAYVARRVGASPVTAELGGVIHRRTDGNALFIVHVFDYVLQQGWLIQQGDQWVLHGDATTLADQVPDSLWSLLVTQVEALAPDAQACLAVASVAGVHFTAAEVAVGLQRAVEDVETVCDRLSQAGQFLTAQALQTWPDGTVTARYAFQHAMYQHVVYARLGSAQRRRLHQRLGERLETGYGARAGEVAARLAVHCERGGEIPRAVHALQQAGTNAVRRKAFHEAILLLTKGLTLLATLQESPARAQHELTLLLTLGGLLMAVQGMRAPEAGAVYARAQALGHQVGEVPQRFRALWGLVTFHRAQGQLRTASAMSLQLATLAQGQPDTGLVRESHIAMGELAFYRGDLSPARTHLEQSLRLSETWQPSTTLVLGGQEPRVTALAWLVQPLWALGYADQARQRGQEALALARLVEHPPSLVYAELYTTLLAQFCRDVTTTHARAQAVMAVAAHQGFGLRVGQGRIFWGWALAMQGDVATGIAHIRQGYAVHQDTGSNLYSPYFLALLAEAYGQGGQPEVGLQVLAEALTLVAATEERWWEAELYRLQGTLRLQLPSPEASQAEASLRQSLEVARRQQAKSLELRAAMSLARLWQQQGKRTEAHALLAEIYGWFTAGFDTADLQEAKALLDALA
jgi:predicted ATPase